MSTTARKTGVTTLVVGFAEGMVAFHKVTTDGGRAAKWDTRLVDEKGKLIEPEKPSGSGDPLTLMTQGDPLGVTEDERQLEHEDHGDELSEAEHLMKTPPPPPVQRQRGFETERYGFVPADAQLKEIDEYAALDAARVVGFVRAEQVYRNRIIDSYYLVPADDTAGAHGRHLMEVLKLALQKTSRFAVVKWTKKKGQCLGVIAPDRSGGLVILELAWGENVRTMPKTGILNGDLAKPEEVEACVEFINVMAEPRASMDELRDDAVVLRQELRALAEDGRVEDFVVPSAPEPPPHAELEEAFGESAERAEVFRAAA